MLHVQETRMIEINLSAPTTPDEQQRNIVANVRLGKGEESVPFMESEEIDENRIEACHQDLKELAPTAVDDGEPNLRFYAVGPATCKILCPLCNQRADTGEVTMLGICGKLNFLLSFLSCCFPIFTLSFLYYCVKVRIASKRLFCKNCGGDLGYYKRPT